MKIMASGPVISWQIGGEAMETMTEFIFLGSRITVDGDCSHEIKRHLILGRKAMMNLDSPKRQSLEVSGFSERERKKISYDNCFKRSSS